MSELKIDYGSISFDSDTEMTIEAVANLVKAAQVAGIPADAVITSLQFQYGFGPEGKATKIHIGWRMK